MEVLRKLAYSVLILAGSSGVGFVLWTIAAPGEQRKQDILQCLPESSSRQMEERRRQNALILEAIKAAADTNANVTYKAPGKK